MKFLKSGYLFKLIGGILSSKNSLSRNLLLICCLLFFLLTVFSCKKGNTEVPDSDWTQRTVIVVVPPAQGYGSSQSDGNGDFLYSVEPLVRQSQSLGYTLQSIIPENPFTADSLVLALLEMTLSDGTPGSQTGGDEGQEPSLIILADRNYGKVVERFRNMHPEIPEKLLYENVLLMETESGNFPCRAMKTELYGAMYIVGSVSSLFGMSTLIMDEMLPEYESAIAGFNDGLNDAFVSRWDLVAPEEPQLIVLSEVLGDDEMEIYTVSDVVEYLLYGSLRVPLVAGIEQDLSVRLDSVFGMFMTGYGPRVVDGINKMVLFVQTETFSVVSDYVLAWLNHDMARMPEYCRYGIESGAVSVKVMPGYEECCQEYIDELWSDAVAKEMKYFSDYQRVIE